MDREHRAVAAVGSSQPVSEGGPNYLNGGDLKRMIWAGYVWMERHKEIVNALNVFPVPDGDTGTNMHLTMQAAWREIDSSDESAIGALAQAVAQGALMGSCGNSGVILSQILRGMAHAFRNKTAINSADLVAGLQRGSETAYKGVVKPVEGTILTVIRKAADAAARAAAVEQDIGFVLEHTVQAAADAVEQTPQLLPVLAKAGVVDSGGKGLYYILEGMRRGLQGETLEGRETAANALPAKSAAMDPYDIPPQRFGYDVQYLIWGTNLDVDAIRQRIGEIGDCPLVEGGPTMVKVHVHAFDPSVPLSYGISQGFLTGVIVENMDAMAAAGIAPDDVQIELAAAVHPGRSYEPEPDADGIAIIAVAPGDGFHAVFQSLGVAAVVPGGQTMNPSTRDLLAAIEQVPNQDLILLPNNSNVIMTAQQAQLVAEERLGKQVRVVPSRTVPQGISAAVAFNLQADLEVNAQAMNRALDNVETGEVTIAVRAVSLDGVDVEVGDVIGLRNGILTTKGATPDEVALDLLNQMNAAEKEILTVYYGDQIAKTQAETLAGQARDLYPEQELEVVAGGQPHYHYILSAE